MLHAARTPVQNESASVTTAVVAKGVIKQAGDIAGVFLEKFESSTLPATVAEKIEQLRQVLDKSDEQERQQYHVRSIYARSVLSAML